MMPGAGAVARVVAGGLTRRKVESLVIGLVLLVSTGACVLALALVADSSAPFDRADGLSHAKTEPVQVTLVGSGGPVKHIGPPGTGGGRRPSSGPSRRRCGRSRERCATPRRPTRRSASPGCPGKSE
jgi:hypothetical protein